MVRFPKLFCPVTLPLAMHGTSNSSISLLTLDIVSLFYVLFVCLEESDMIPPRLKDSHSRSSTEQWLEKRELAQKDPS